MDSLFVDPRYFAQIELATANETPVDWSNGTTKENVTSAIRSCLGPDFVLGGAKYLKSTGLPLFDKLTELLPHSSSQVAFFWRTVGHTFASMLDTARFPLPSQARFLVWIYARVLGLMGPENGTVHSVMTNDGSPIELSWIIPNRSRPAAEEVTRQIRFAIEPIDPRNGKLLPASIVLAYLTSPLGSLGVVECGAGGMEWRNKAERFLFPNTSSEVLAEGSRFFVGFDFKSSGTLTLKAYYIPASRPTALSLSKQTNGLGAPFPIYCGDADFLPLCQLISKLDPTMIEPLNLMIEYFESLEDRLRPRFQILAMDCVPNKSNRLKIYCMTMEGTSWSDAKRTFTLGDRLSSPAMTSHLAQLESLWNDMFPNATSPHDCDLVAKSSVDADHDQEAENDPTKEHDQHPRGGLLFYYELTAGKNTVSPKLYLPVRHYCEDDLFVTQALEKFYHRNNIQGPEGGETGPGWVSREVAKAHNRRPLDEKSGVQTYVAFAVKGGGWELMDYFSPELWI